MECASVKNRLSALAHRMGSDSGIVKLMDDLGRAMDGTDDILMLGGGNPAAVPEVQAIWRRRMRELLSDGERFDRMLVNYDTPRGSAEFLQSMADFLNRHCGWDIGPQNVAVLNGTQTAAFCLINLLAGSGDDATPTRKILLPTSPEYIGYADQSLTPGGIHSLRPNIELIGTNDFRYRIAFDRLEVNDSVGAVMVSRPTNPTGNVISDADLDRLVTTCSEHGVPLIIDNAYGNPFPGAIFTEATLPWSDTTVHTFSLSKVGLPGTRTGIVVGPPWVIDAVAAMNGVLGLANGNIGQAMVLEMLKSGEILHVSRDLIRPFYAKKSQQARQWIAEYFPATLDYRVHVSEGAFFLWLWFPQLPISSRELYERLRRRGVLVVPGDSFFYGLDEPWEHAQQCIRLTFSQDDATVQAGLRLIADELETLVDADQRPSALNRGH